MSYPVMLGAIVITAANQRIRFREAAGAVGNVDLALGTYYLRGDGAAGDFLLELKNKLDAFGVGGNTYTITVARSINPAVAHTTITVTQSGGLTFGFVIDGSQTFDYSLIGFSTTTSTANDTAPKTSIAACSSAWVCNDVAREIEPYSERTVAVPRAVSGRVQGVTRSARMQSWRLGLAFIDERRTYIENALAGAQDTLEGFIERFGAGASLELHEQASVTGVALGALSSSTLVDVCHFSEDTLSRFEPTRLGPGVPLYSIDLRLHARV